MEEERHDESTVKNFKQVARKAGISPKSSAKGGKRTKK